MATLTAADGTPCPLRSTHLVGRSPRADLQLEERSISGEHASIRWNGRSWIVRDLGSRNGTWVDGERLPTGGDAVLRQGAAVGFGALQDAYVLTDAAPPRVRALDLASREPVFGGGDLLALPSEEEPLLVILPDRDQGWVLEDGEASRPVSDGEIVALGDRRWQLFLPEAITRTWDASQAATPALEDCRLAFRVSLDEEHVELSVESQGTRHDLDTRAHHYLLLTLARQRQADDQADPPLPETARGWVHQDELRKMLGYSASGLHVAIFRARREFESLGVRSATEIVERRRQAQQVRLGIATVTIDRI